MEAVSLYEAPDSTSCTGDYLLVETDSLEELKGPIGRSARLKYTCMDVSSKYIALGSNTGSVYVFDRKTRKHLQVVFPESEPSSVNIVAICPSNKSVAFSNVNGNVNVMMLNIEKRLKPDKLRLVTDHLHTTVMYLKWDNQGHKLFSADLLGKVVVAVIPSSKVKNLVLMPAEVIMKLDSAIVQLDWFSDRLLVSTMTKVCLCNTIKQQYSHVGKKAREGSYGSVFYINPRATVPLIYSARPGSRLWEVDFEGNVLNTHQFKQMLAVPPLPIVQVKDGISSWPELSRKMNAPQGVNFPELKMLCDQFVLSWNKSRLYILDPASDVPNVLLWAELEKEIQNVCSIGTDIYVFHANSELLHLQLLSASQCVTLLTGRAEWLIAARICSEFESSILRTQHNKVLSTRTLSKLYEKCSDLGNLKFMETLSRILLGFETGSNSEGDETSGRSRSSSGASIVRLDSGIYQISPQKRGSSQSLSSMNNETRAELVVENDATLNGLVSRGTKTEKIAVTNGDVSEFIKSNVIDLSLPVIGDSQSIECNGHDIGLINTKTDTEESLNEGQDNGQKHTGDALLEFQVQRNETLDLPSSHTSEKEEFPCSRQVSLEVQNKEVNVLREKFSNTDKNKSCFDESECDITTIGTNSEENVSVFDKGSIEEDDIGHEGQGKVEISPKIHVDDIFADDPQMPMAIRKTVKKRKKNKNSTACDKKNKNGDNKFQKNESNEEDQKRDEIDGKVGDASTCIVNDGKECHIYDQNDNKRSLSCKQSESDKGFTEKERERQTNTVVSESQDKMSRRQEEMTENIHGQIVDLQPHLRQNKGAQNQVQYDQVQIDNIQTLNTQSKLNQVQYNESKGQYNEMQIQGTQFPNDVDQVQYEDSQSQNCQKFVMQKETKMENSQGQSGDLKAQNTQGQEDFDLTRLDGGQIHINFKNSCQNDSSALPSIDQGQNNKKNELGDVCVTSTEDTEVMQTRSESIVTATQTDFIDHELELRNAQTADILQMEDSSPIIAREPLSTVHSAEGRRKKAVTATIISPGEETQQPKKFSPKGTRSYKRIQSYGPSPENFSSMGGYSKDRMRKRSSMPDLKTSENDFDSSSPTESALTRSWEGVEPSTSPKMSLSTVRDKVQSKLTNTKMKILKTIKEKNILPKAPHEEATTQQPMDTVDGSLIEEDSTLKEIKQEEETINSPMIDLSDLKAWTDQSKTALQNPTILLDTELTREVLSKWVVHLHTALKQLYLILELRKQKHRNTEKVKVDIEKEDDEMETVCVTNERLVNENKNDERTDSLDRENLPHTKMNFEDDTMVPHSDFAVDLDDMINVEDPFSFDVELRADVQMLAQMCFATKCFGAISKFMGAEYSSMCSDSCQNSGLNHSNPVCDIIEQTENLNENVQKGYRTSLADSEKTGLHEEKKSIGEGDEFMLTKNSNSESAEEKDHDEQRWNPCEGIGSEINKDEQNKISYDESIFIGCYFWLLDTGEIQERIYSDDDSTDFNETEIFAVWVSLLKCMQASSKADTVWENLCSNSMEDALYMLNHGLYKRENTLGYLAKLFEVDAACSVQFAVDCVHIAALDIVFLCRLYGKPMKEHLHVFLSARMESAVKLLRSEITPASLPVYIGKTWLSILMSKQSHDAMFNSSGTPRFSSHRQQWEHEDKIQGIVGTMSRKKWQPYLDFCSYNGYWKGCLKLMRKLEMYQPMLQMILHLGDVTLLSDEYYIPSTKEEWNDFVNMYNKFITQHSTVCCRQSVSHNAQNIRDLQDASISDEKKNVCSDSFHNNSLHSDKDDIEDTGKVTLALEQDQCQGHCITWMDIADLLMQNLDTVACINILQQYEVQNGSLSQEFYRKAIVSCMIEKQQRNVSHNLLEKIDSYLWTQKPNTLMPELHFAASNEKKSIKVKSESEGQLSLSTLLARDEVTVRRYREDYECHWGVSAKISRCRICNLMLTESVSHIEPGVLIFPCGHGFHRFCCSEKQCLLCLE